MFGKVELSEQDYKEVISLAKEGVLSRSKIHTLEQKAQKANGKGLGTGRQANQVIYEYKRF